MSDNPREEIFAAVRAKARPGLFSDPGNIRALDNLLDAFDVPRGASVVQRKTSDSGIRLMEEFEGFAKVLPDGRVQAYPDPGTGGAPWTIGFGSTTDEVGKAIAPGTIWTRERAEKRFARDLERFEREVAQAIGGAPTTQAQFDALVSFHYNTGAIGSATLTKKHIAGDYAGAKAEFARWNRAGGRVMTGLTRRRAAEAELYAS